MARHTASFGVLLCSKLLKLDSKALNSPPLLIHVNVGNN